MQIVLWKRLTQEDLQLDPEQWGWKLDGTTLTPVMAAAPDLLKFVYICDASASFLLEIHVYALATKNGQMVSNV